MIMEGERVFRLDEREVAQSSPSEEELRGELKELNRQLAELNDEAGRVESERRSVQHRLRETAKLLQAIQAGTVKGQFAAGRYPKTENPARRR